MPTVTEIQSIAKFSQMLANIDIANGALFGARINPNIAIQIYLVRKPVEYQYNLEDIDGGNTPSASLTNTSNYLFSLCGKYGLSALALINGGGVVPNPFSNTVYSIPISGQYTATADGETVLTLRDVNGTALPTGSRITWVMKSTTPLTSLDYTYIVPTLTLLNGIEMSMDEILSFQYVVPV